MERITISLDDALLAAFDAYLSRKGYENRSEAIRDLLRQRLESDRLAEDRADEVMACLSYVYNHHQRDLASRLTENQHAHHDLIRSTLHVHLDHENCLEVAVLQGPTAEVRRLADATVAETGVRHGNLHLIPTAPGPRHRHAHLHVDGDEHGREHGRDHDHGHGQGHGYAPRPFHRHSSPTS